MYICKKRHTIVCQYFRVIPKILWLNHNHSSLVLKHILDRLNCKYKTDLTHQFQSVFKHIHLMSCFGKLRRAITSLAKTTHRHNLWFSPLILLSSPSPSLPSSSTPPLSWPSWPGVLRVRGARCSDDNSTRSWLARIHSSHHHHHRHNHLHLAKADWLIADKA